MKNGKIKNLADSEVGRRGHPEAAERTDADSLSIPASDGVGGLQAPRGHTVYAVALRGYTISLTKREPQHSASDGVGGLQASRGHTVPTCCSSYRSYNTCCSSYRSYNTCML